MEEGHSRQEYPCGSTVVPLNEAHTRGTEGKVDGRGHSHQSCTIQSLWMSKDRLVMSTTILDVARGAGGGQPRMTEQPVRGKQQPVWTCSPKSLVNEGRTITSRSSSA